VKSQVNDVHFSDLERPIKNEKKDFVKRTENKTGNIKFKKNEKSDIVNIKANGKITR
tara:strand:+ start:118 stop:288 length:171 start_codon:yes stop_codon:yes gene_type:complete